MRQDTKDAIRKCHLFASADDPSVAALAQASRFVRFRAGQVLFMAGDAPDGLYVLQSGLVRIWIADADGRELTIALMEPGDPFRRDRPARWPAPHGKRDGAGADRMRAHPAGRARCGAGRQPDTRAPPDRPSMRTPAPQHRGDGRFRLPRPRQPAGAETARSRRRPQRDRRRRGAVHPAVLAIRSRPDAGRDPRSGQQTPRRLRPRRAHRAGGRRATVPDLAALAARARAGEGLVRRGV